MNVVCEAEVDDGQEVWVPGSTIPKERFLCVEARIQSSMVTDQYRRHGARARHCSACIETGTSSTRNLDVGLGASTRLLPPTAGCHARGAATSALLEVGSTSGKGRLWPSTTLQGMRWSKWLLSLTRAKPSVAFKHHAGAQELESIFTAVPKFFVDLASRL